jgi:hypothetical protein
MAFTMARLLRLGRPGLPRSGGRSGATSRHCPSVNSILGIHKPRAKRRVGPSQAAHGNRFEDAP